MKSLIHGFTHYVDFYGRDSRSTFWGFIVGTHLILILLFAPILYTLIDAFRLIIENPQIMDLLSSMEDKAATQEEIIEITKQLFQDYSVSPLVIICFYLCVMWGAGIILPTISATVRRLRDAGQSPYWAAAPAVNLMPYLGGFLGLVAGIVILAMCCLPSVQQSAEQPGEADAPPPIPPQE